MWGIPRYYGWVYSTHIRCTVGKVNHTRKYGEFPTFHGEFPTFHGEFPTIDWRNLLIWKDKRFPKQGKNRKKTILAVGNFWNLAFKILAGGYWMGFVGVLFLQPQLLPLHQFFAEKGLGCIFAQRFRTNCLVGFFSKCCSEYRSHSDKI